MTTPDSSVPASYFENLYERDPDPWRFGTSSYERDKYAATLSVIGDEPVTSACEVGCSIGVFTEALAPHCAALLGLDVAESALAKARRRCAHQPWVTFQQMRIPREWPAGPFDLMVFSEVLYFLSAYDVRVTARRAVATLAPGGRVVLVNWTGETGHTLNGEMAAEIFHDAAASGLMAIFRDRRPGYRLEVFRRRGTMGHTRIRNVFTRD